MQSFYTALCANLEKNRSPGKQLLIRERPRMHEYLNKNVKLICLYITHPNQYLGTHDHYFFTLVQYRYRCSRLNVFILLVDTLFVVRLLSDDSEDKGKRISSRFGYIAFSFTYHRRARYLTRVYYTSTVEERHSKSETL